MRARTLARRSAVTVLSTAALMLVGASPATAAEDTYTCAFSGTVNFSPPIPLAGASQGDYSFSGTGACEQFDWDFAGGTDLLNNNGTFQILISSDGWYDNTDCSVGHGHGHGLSPSNKPAVTTIAKDTLGTSVPPAAGDEAIFSGLEYHATYALGNGQLDFYAGADLDGSSPPTTTAGTFHVTSTGGGCTNSALASANVSGSFSFDAG